MGFQRASWKSGLIYQQTCDRCNTTIRYMDDKLDFRPWYADGFIYCPSCEKPLRHRETYAITESEPKIINVAGEPTAPAASEGAAFCTQCGKAFRQGDRFCSGCGTKRTE